MCSETRSNRGILAAAAIVLALGSCNARSRVAHPTFPGGGLLLHATPLTQGALGALQGFFDVGEGEKLFGPHVAGRASPGRLSFFGRRDSILAILEAGCIDDGDTLVLEGTWRHPTSTETGLVRLFAGPIEAARALCGGAEEAPAGIGPLTFSGATGEEYDLPSESVSFEHTRPLAPMVGTFAVVAHHGTQTIEDYGASENTVEGFRIAEQMGAGGVEVDVRMTRDGVPIMFHDAGFTARLVEGRFCQGNVADLTFSQIRASCRNKYGEKVQSLEEGLAGIMDETSLRGAWVDVKEPEGVAPSLVVMRGAEARAAAKNRPWVNVLGLSSDEMVDAYKAAKPPPGTRCIVEHDPDLALQIGCQAWGPRFTEGPQPERVHEVQSKGLAVLFWTVDGAELIEEFLGSKPNGMISDTPGLAFYLFQERPWKPAGGDLP